MEGKENIDKLFKIAYVRFNKMVENKSFYLAVITDEDMKSADTENRWSLTTAHGNENLSSHSWWVSIFTWMLCKKQMYDDSKIGRAMTYASFHDLDEVFTGDLNHKFKYDINNGINREQVKEYGKRKVTEKLKSFGIVEDDIKSTFEVEEEIKKLVKIADWLSALQYLSFELQLGNRTTKVRQDFVYCLIGICKAIKDFSIEKDRAEIDSDLAALFLDLSKINDKLYE